MSAVTTRSPRPARLTISLSATSKPGSDLHALDEWRGRHPGPADWRPGSPSPRSVRPPGTGSPGSPPGTHRRPPQIFMSRQILPRAACARPSPSTRRLENRSRSMFRDMWKLKGRPGRPQLSSVHALLRRWLGLANPMPHHPPALPSGPDCSGSSTLPRPIEQAAQPGQGHAILLSRRRFLRADHVFERRNQDA